MKMNRVILKGDIPSPVNPPKGCKFHTRCDQCMEICKSVPPKYKQVEEGHFCACHLYDTQEDIADYETAVAAAKLAAAANIDFANAVKEKTEKNAADEKGKSLIETEEVDVVGACPNCGKRIVFKAGQKQTMCPACESIILLKDLK